MRLLGYNIDGKFSEVIQGVKLNLHVVGGTKTFLPKVKQKNTKIEQTLSKSWKYKKVISENSMIQVMRTSIHSFLKLFVTFRSKPLDVSILRHRQQQQTLPQRTCTGNLTFFFLWTNSVFFTLGCMRWSRICETKKLVGCHEWIS